MQFSTERIAGAVLSVVSFGMGVGGGSNVLEIRFCYWLFVSRQCASARGCAAGTEENDCDESRENG